jgi:hypothetical protein
MAMKELLVKCIPDAKSRGESEELMPNSGGGRQFR